MHLPRLVHIYFSFCGSCHKLLIEKGDYPVLSSLPRTLDLPRVLRFLTLGPPIRLRDSPVPVKVLLSLGLSSPKALARLGCVHFSLLL